MLFDTSLWLLTSPLLNPSVLGAGCRIHLSPATCHAKGTYLIQIAMPKEFGWMFIPVAWKTHWTKNSSKKTLRISLFQRRFATTTCWLYFPAWLRDGLVEVGTLQLADWAECQPWSFALFFGPSYNSVPKACGPTGRSQNLAGIRSDIIWTWFEIWQIRNTWEKTRALWSFIWLWMFHFCSLTSDQNIGFGGCFRMGTCSGSPNGVHDGCPPLPKWSSPRMHCLQTIHI